MEASHFLVPNPTTKVQCSKQCDDDFRMDTQTSTLGLSPEASPDARGRLVFNRVPGLFSKEGTVSSTSGCSCAKEQC